MFATLRTKAAPTTVVWSVILLREPPHGLWLPTTQRVTMEMAAPKRTPVRPAPVWAATKIATTVRDAALQVAWMTSASTSHSTTVLSATTTTRALKTMHVTPACVPVPI
jgi:hypothetical protein